MEHPENNEEYKGLVVNKGIEQPSSVNPYLKRKPKKRQLSVAEFVEGIVKGDVTILSQAVTLVESVKPEHQAVAQEVCSYAAWSWPWEPAWAEKRSLNPWAWTW